MTELSLRELEDELATLASHLYAGTCRWLELVAELDRRGSWSESGSGSCAEWLAWRCALSPRAAREHVRVARVLPQLPLIHESFSRGELSYAKVRALTRVATTESEEELLGLARALTAAQLDRAVAAYRRVSAAEANDLHGSAYVVYHWDEDGSLYIQGRLTPEDGALFLRALEAGRDLLREREREWDEERWQRIERGPAGPHEPRYRPTNADALVAMAEASLTAKNVEGVSAERYQVVINADGDGSSGLEDGPALARETVERLSCDASLVRSGRKSRTIPPATRRALRTRDRGCRFPGCDNRRFVDAHHIRHWAHGGETKTDNLVLLCRRHHRFLHEGGYSIERLADGELRFRDSWGTVIPDVPRSPPGDAEQLLVAQSPRQINGQSCASGDGLPMDLEVVVEALVELRRAA